MGPGEKYCDIKTLLTEDSAVRIVVIVVFSSRPSISTQLRIIITNTDTKPTPAPFTPPPPKTNKTNKTMTTPDPSTIALHGWTAVPVDAAAVLQGKPYLNPPTPLLAKDIPFPSSDPLVSRVQKYAKEQLPPQTYNHSMRVFYWGISPPPMSPLPS